LSRGKLTVITGMSASGKTTLQHYLKEQAESAGTVFLSQPPQSWRADPRVQRMFAGESVPGFSEREEIELSLSTRLVQQVELIRPALAAGKNVYLHRYIYSLAAYYYTFNPELLHLIYNRFDDFVTPDTIYYLDISAEESIRRIKLRDKWYPDFLIDLERARSFRQYYLSCVDRFHFHRIDATAYNGPAALWQRCLASSDRGKHRGFKS